MPVISDDFITPISKKVVLKGNIFIVLFIIMILCVPFFCKTRQKIAIEANLEYSQDTTRTAYCIISEAEYKSVDLNRLTLMQEYVKKYGIEKYEISNITYNLESEEYVISIIIQSNYANCKLPFVIIPGYIESKPMTWGHVIYNLNK